MNYGIPKLNFNRIANYLIIEVRLPFWILSTIIIIGSFPYLVLVLHFIDNTRFSSISKLIISNSKELFLAASTFLLIRNAITLFITKKLLQEKSESDSIIANEAKESMRLYSLLTKQELFELQASLKREKRERINEQKEFSEILTKIKEQHIELRVKVSMLLTLTDNDYDKRKDK